MEPAELGRLKQELRDKQRVCLKCGRSLTDGEMVVFQKSSSDDWLTCVACTSPVYIQSPWSKVKINISGLWLKFMKRLQREYGTATTPEEAQGAEDPDSPPVQPSILRTAADALIDRAALTPFADAIRVTPLEPEPPDELRDRLPLYQNYREANTGPHTFGEDE